MLGLIQSHPGFLVQHLSYLSSIYSSVGFDPLCLLQEHYDNFSLKRRCCEMHQRRHPWWYKTSAFTHSPFIPPLLCLEACIPGTELGAEGSIKNQVIELPALLQLPSPDWSVRTMHVFQVGISTWLCRLHSEHWQPPAKTLNSNFRRVRAVSES